VGGPEIRANASKQANRIEAGLRKLARKMLDDAARADGAGQAETAIAGITASQGNPIMTRRFIVP
jgi:hypothetical protein